MPAQRISTPNHSAKSSESPLFSKRLLKGRIQFGALLGQTTFLEPCEFLCNSFLDSLATIWKNLFPNQSIKTIQGGFI